jgi:hypothetical protein
MTHIHAGRPQIGTHAVQVSRVVTPSSRFCIADSYNVHPAIWNALETGDMPRRPASMKDTDNLEGRTMGLLRKITAVSTLGASELARPTNIRKMTGTCTAPPVVVKTYKNAKEYEHDVKSMTG